MSQLFSNYVRKPFVVSAARITPMNIEEIAKECGGTVFEGEKEGNLSRKSIRFQSTYGKQTKTLEAHVGDWMVRSGKNFRFYNDGAFQRTFESQSNSSGQRQSNKKKSKTSRKAPTPNVMPQRVVPNGIQLEEKFSGTLTNVPKD